MQLDRRFLAAALVAAVVGAAVGAGAVSVIQPTDAGPAAPTTDDPSDGSTDGTTDDTPTGPADDPALEQFESKAAFQAYLQQADPRERARPTAFAGGDGGDAGRPVETDEVVERDAGVTRTVTDEATRTPAPTQTAMETEAAEGGATGDAGDDPDRYSSTNVQVTGIQEPDVLKSDGETIYYSPPRTRGGHHERRTDRGTWTINASRPADPSILGRIDETGRMFLAGDRLVVLADDEVVGYDVSNPESPSRTFEKHLNGRVAAARLYDGSVYLVVQQGIDEDEPCPIEPLGVEGPAVECTDVYHPVGESNAEVTYTTVQLDPGTGSVEDSVSVVGSRDHSATYMSENGVYLTYTRRTSTTDLLSTYLLDNKSDVLDERTRQRLREIRSYDLSDRARRIEIQSALQNWLQTLDEHRRDDVRDELFEGFRNYRAERKRELVTTGVVRVGIDGGLSVEATGEVPGYPLDQFAMSEADGRLRIATTIPRLGGGIESVNDLYVLDSNLDRMGSVQGMSEGQRIYSVRYVGDTAYVVTFRQVDPFHVIDLSNPGDPEELGQVKLPGFSRYLHPLGDQKVLGIGEEDGRVKATIFDVSDPTNPEVLDSKRIDDRWSAISRTHHAFLLDRKHGVFFLPGSEGGYVMGYEDGLSLERRVDTPGAATRAMYIDDYMYVFAEEGAVVVEETDWTRTARLSFGATGGVPKVAVDWNYEEFDGELTVHHVAGRTLQGENLVLECGATEIEAGSGTYEPGEVLFDTTACEPGQEARLAWAPRGDRSVVLSEFDIPTDDSN